MCNTSRAHPQEYFRSLLAKQEVEEVDTREDDTPCIEVDQLGQDCQPALDVSEIRECLEQEL